jgi:SAM-dependent methyltransferase
MKLSRQLKVSAKEFVKHFFASRGYDLVRRTPRPQWPEETSRFEYQKLFNAFDIAPGSVVLDIGSGNYPFPLATILTDRYVETTQHRSEKLVLDERPFLLSDIEHLPFANKTIDFVYCSHVLEHVNNPVQVCSEIVRVGKRGYIETPTLAKDMLFSWAKGMHKWYIVGIAERLIFFEYSERQLEGVRYDAWRKAIFAPYHHPLQDVYYNNPDIFNVMFSWNGGFECVVYYLDGRVANASLR